MSSPNSSSQTAQPAIPNPNTQTSYPDPNPSPSAANDSIVPSEPLREEDLIGSRDNTSTPITDLPPNQVLPNDLFEPTLTPATKSKSPPSPIPKPTRKNTVPQLRSGLATLGLDTTGKKETLWRRLVNAFNQITLAAPIAQAESGYESDIKAEESTESSLSPERKGAGDSQKYTSFLCFDVEATCRGGKEFNWVNEIIEFPVVLCQFVDSPLEEGEAGPSGATSKKVLKRIDTFHSYVRPTWRPILTDFCVGLTGITQEMVDRAPTFPEVVEKFEEWLDGLGLRVNGELVDTLWVTDGPWDLRDFIPKQIHITPLSPNPYPSYFLGPYLNLKQATQTVLSESWRREQYAKEHPNQPPNARALSRISTSRAINKVQRDGSKMPVGPNWHLPISGQCEALGLGEFVGRQHSGIDDATNISRILIALAERNVLLEPNGNLYKQGKRWPWMGEPGVVKYEKWMDERGGAEGVRSGVGMAEATGGSGRVPERVRERKGDGVEDGEARVQIETMGMDDGHGVDADDKEKKSGDNKDRAEGRAMIATEIEVSV